MNELLITLKEWWGLIVMIGGGIGGYFRWKASRDKSSNMLYEQMEKLKQKVILQVEREVQQETEIAEKDRIIEGLKRHCPDCYDKYIQKNYKPYES